MFQISKIRFKTASFTRTLFVVVTLTAAVAGTFLVHQIVENYSLKFDMTATKLYELSPTTDNVAASLQSPVEITVLNSKEDYVVVLKELLKKYESLSSLIEVKYVDPYENPALLDHFRQEGLNVKLNDIVVDGRFRTRSFSVEDLYIMNADKTEVRGLNAEHQLTSALVYVNDQSTPVVGFTDGHNERPSTSFIELFEDNNFEVQQGSVSTLVEDEPSLLVIASPRRDFRSDEVELLESYLSRGGALMTFIGPSLGSLDELESLLEEWGIVLGNELVVEKEGYTGNNPVNVVPMYAPHEINRYFSENRVFLTMPSSRSLYKNPEAGSAYDIRAVLVSTGQAYGKEGYQFESTERSEDDKSGPFTLALTSSKTVSVNGNEREAKIFTAGSQNMYGDDLLGYASYANADFLIQAVNWLHETETAINIPPKKIEAAPLNLLSSRALLLGVLVTVPVPILILSIGIIVVIRRKRLS
ncbi:MAG: Gldg family protein [Spirochaetaceae bacterium]